jgi:hypothetical protein
MRNSGFASRYCCFDIEVVGKPQKGVPLVFDRREAFHDLGRVVYGLAGIALGMIGLVWRDFAAVWQPLENLGAVSHRETLACVFAVGLLSAGAAAMWRRTAQAGLLVLAALHFISALGWVPRVIGYPGIYGTWNGFFEQLSLVAAGVVACASLAPLTSVWKARTLQISRFVFGICAVSFGVSHFMAIAETASMVPKWLPPGQQFWAWATDFGVNDSGGLIAFQHDARGGVTGLLVNTGEGSEFFGRRLSSAP